MSVTFNIIDELIDTIKQHSMREFELIIPFLERNEINERSATGLAPIHYACLEGQIKMVECLLRNKANPSLQDVEGWTPLHIAATTNNYDLAVCLMGFGADLSVSNGDQETPFEVAEADELIRLLERKGSSESDAEEREEQEEQALLSALRKAKRMNCVDKWEESLGISEEGSILHLAAAYGYCHLVEYICEEKLVNVNGKDRDEWTPLHVASYWQYSDIMEVLLTHGANPCLVTKVYNRPSDL
ncbi:Protein phosphatase 1 regulatory subunit 12A-like [Oopsacas minuta]|uniref:Protein phosphatase 1 regulatory subunit 12A-like n=1 Tax=Oopsacas minuta TaxID=111878 RepID=A0AAV7JTZ4_9METZ|nr:Protein phosphatase 1 regulatory subunit 12A-like [Oopsacas minuta]